MASSTYKGNDFEFVAVRECCGGEFLSGNDLSVELDSDPVRDDAELFEQLRKRQAVGDVARFSVYGYAQAFSPSINAATCSHTHWARPSRLYPPSRADMTLPFAVSREASQTFCVIQAKS
jgi:hypothetical protein